MDKYSEIHRWIYKEFGSPNTCEFCKSEHVGRNMHWANISGEYKRIKNDWLRLCRWCHRKFDSERWGWDGKIWVDIKPTVKRILIDIPNQEVERLRIEAIKNGISFKKYLECKILGKLSSVNYNNKLHRGTKEIVKKDPVSRIITKKPKKRTCKHKKQQSNGHAQSCTCLMCS